MDTGHFYFLTDSYFIDFPDTYLMKNKEVVNGQSHDRPCFYSFLDVQTGLFWMIPFSSNTAKFHFEYGKKMQRYGRCDTIAFGQVLGMEKAFLIQNMCPITEAYVNNEYIETTSGSPVRLDSAFEFELTRKAKRVLQVVRSGKKLIFPDVLAIEQELLLTRTQ